MAQTGDEEMQSGEIFVKFDQKNDLLLCVIAEQNLLLLNLPLSFDEIQRRLQAMWEESPQNIGNGDAQTLNAVFFRMNDLMRQKYNLHVTYAQIHSTTENKAEAYLQGMNAFYQALQRVNSKNATISEQAKSLVMKEDRRTISLAEAAEQINISPNYLCRVFKEETGETFRSYCIRVKMGRAAALLKESNLRINEIGTAVGYPNTAYFNKLFKRNFRCTPREYKKTFR
jgi:YesN/AraC family two-component response regulator